MKDLDREIAKHYLSGSKSPLTSGQLQSLNLVDTVIQGQNSLAAFDQDTQDKIALISMQYVAEQESRLAALEAEVAALKNK